MSFFLSYFKFILSLSVPDISHSTIGEKDFCSEIILDFFSGVVSYSRFTSFDPLNCRIFGFLNSLVGKLKVRDYLNLRSEISLLSLWTSTTVFNFYFISKDSGDLCETFKDILLSKFSL